jgi:argininosuccinate lyase
MKLWQTTDSLDSRVETFTTGLDPELDQEIIPFDCTASIAHTSMLASIGVLTPEEAQSIKDTLVEIVNLHGNGQFHIAFDQEDGHTAIENYLVEKLGDLGKKVHTGRSRNDQVLTAMRLYEIEALQGIMSEVELLAGKFGQFAAKYADMPIPGYTHTRKAMPFTVGQWARAFQDSMNDNLIFLKATLSVVDQNPLGTGAGYGVPLPVDRELTTGLLGFSKVMSNPMYAQNSRGKFEARILSDCLMVLYDLNKFASDVIFFSLPDLGYFSLDNSLVTGSSIMPHKQNPDVLELIRASAHQVAGYEYQLKNIPLNLISGYHRDLQLTKEPIIRGLKASRDAIGVTSVVLDGLQVNARQLAGSMTDELLSVKKVMDLVKSGTPFRDAYRRIAELYKPEKPEKPEV